MYIELFRDSQSSLINRTLNKNPFSRVPISAEYKFFIRVYTKSRFKF